MKKYLPFNGSQTFLSLSQNRVIFQARWSYYTSTYPIFITDFNVTLMLISLFPEWSIAFSFYVKYFVPHAPHFLLPFNLFTLIINTVLTRLPTYLPTYLFPYLLTYLSTYLLHNYLPTYLPTYLITYLLTYIPTYLITYLLNYLPIYLPTYLFTYLLT